MRFVVLRTNVEGVDYELHGGNGKCTIWYNGLSVPNRMGWPPVSFIGIDLRCRGCLVFEYVRHSGEKLRVCQSKSLFN